MNMGTTQFNFEINPAQPGIWIIYDQGEPIGCIVMLKTYNNAQFAKCTLK